MAGACARPTGSSGPRSSVRSCRGPRWSSAITAAGSRTSWPPTTWRSARTTWTSYTITAPQHPDLPGRRRLHGHLSRSADAGGSQLRHVREGLRHRSHYWHGFDFNANARMANGLVLQGGTSTGRGRREFCEVSAKLPEMFLGGDAADDLCVRRHRAVADAGPRARVLRRAEDRGPGQHQLPVQAGHARHRRQRLGHQRHVDQRQLRGAELRASRRRSAGCRPAGWPTATPPWTCCCRASSTATASTRWTCGSRRSCGWAGPAAQVGVDLYNVLNANPGLTYNQAFTGAGATWLRPTSILLPRFARFNVTVDF